MTKVEEQGTRLRNWLGARGVRSSIAGSRKEKEEKSFIR
jgi:hypothetical protein